MQLQQDLSPTEMPAKYLEMDFAEVRVKGLLAELEIEGLVWS